MIVVRCQCNKEAILDKLNAKDDDKAIMYEIKDNGIAYYIYLITFDLAAQMLR